MKRSTPKDRLRPAPSGTLTAPRADAILIGMKTFFRVVTTALSLTACIVALGAVATLLYDAVAGRRGDYGIFGILMLTGLLVGQCRILWILVHPDNGPESEPQAPFGPVTSHAQVRAQVRAPARPQARPR